MGRINKRGLSSHAFVYLLAGIIIVLMLFFGIMTINKSGESEKQVEITKFKEDTKKSVYENRFIEELISRINQPIR